MGEKESAYIIDVIRTPQGRRNGALSNVHPNTLAQLVISSVISRVNLDPKFINEVILGCATQTGKQGFNSARLASVGAFGVFMPASTINMLCGSSAQAIRFATSQILSGENDLVIAGGFESNSDFQVPMGSDMLPPPVDLKNIWQVIKYGKKSINFTLPEHYEFYHMGKSGDLIAEKYNLKRSELDDFAFNSHMKAKTTRDNGDFENEIIAVKTVSGMFSKDEGIRGDTSLEKLASLKPSFGGLHTPGNSSFISDGASAVLIANDNAVKKYGLKPRARILASAVVGVDTKLQLLGPIDAMKKVLDKANLKKEDIDLYEINEAFASVVLATIKDCGLDKEKVNVSGGAIALGHPLGASGARLPTTLLNALEKRKLKRGLYVLCIGGGQAIATIIERM